MSLKEAIKKSIEIEELIINSGNAIGESLSSVKKRLDEIDDSMEWTKHDDLLAIEDLVIKANYSSWKVAKEYLDKEYPFNTPIFIATDGAAGLTLEQGEQLAEYLVKKIAYLRGKN